MKDLNASIPVLETSLFFWYKDEIKLDIKKELHWVRSKQGPAPKFEPVISIEKYRKTN